MIDRPTIIITSIGRTGTKFFATLFKDILVDSSAFHEPDIVQYFGISDRLTPFIKQVKDAGAYNMFFLKPLGKWSLIKLSDARLHGKISYEEGVKKILSYRANFIYSKKGAIYVESSAGYYGLIDLLIDVYEHHRAIYIIRDGREWVTSAMNVGEIYGKEGLRRWLAHHWPTAQNMVGDIYAECWNSLTRFEKLCWAWSRLNEYAVTSISKNPSAKLYRFEDIFLSEDRYQHLSNLVDFVTDLPGINLNRIGSIDGWLDRKIHKSSGEFPNCQNWTSSQKSQFNALCGPLMEKLGYDLE